VAELDVAATADPEEDMRLWTLGVECFPPDPGGLEREDRALIEELRKEVEALRALKVKEPRFKIARDPSLPGRPYDPYFVDVITPALINTMATPDQICTILRKIRPYKLPCLPRPPALTCNFVRAG
jgi:hypothetical protein